MQQNSSFEFVYSYSILEKATAPHTSALAWKIPWTEEPVGCSPRGHKELDTTERLPFHFSLSCIGEGNGNPLQCSCLENPREGGAWWAAVYGVAQSQTRLKRLSSSSSIPYWSLHWVWPLRKRNYWIVFQSSIHLGFFRLRVLFGNSIQLLLGLDS